MQSTIIPKPDTIDQAIDWVYRLGALRAALELQLWEQVPAEGDTAEGLVMRTGWNFNGTRALLDAMTALGLMTRAGDRYLPSAEASQFLDPRKPAYQGGVLLNELHWEADGRLAEGIRTGMRPLQYDAATAGATPLWKAFYGRNWALQESFFERSDQIWQSLAVQPRPGLRVLDIACGPTPRTLALARAHPGVQLTWVDWKDVLDAALQGAERLEIAGQVATIPGSLWEVDFGTGYDLAYLGNVTHFFSPEQNILLLRKVNAALVPAGTVAISAIRRDAGEFQWDAIWLYAASACGGAYDFSEYRSMLETAGFTGVEDINHGPIKAVAG